MGRFDPDTGEFFDSNGELVQVFYKGSIIAKDEMTPGEWKKMLADKNSFWGSLF